VNLHDRYTVDKSRPLDSPEVAKNRTFRKGKVELVGVSTNFLPTTLTDVVAGIVKVTAD